MKTGRTIATTRYNVIVQSDPSTGFAIPFTINEAPGEGQPSNGHDNERTKTMTTTALLPGPTMIAIANGERTLMIDGVCVGIIRTITGASRVISREERGLRTRLCTELPRYAPLHAYASAIEQHLATIHRERDKQIAEQERQVAARARARQGDWRAILEEPHGRRYADGASCPRGTLPQAALRRARAWMRERKQRREDRLASQRAYVSEPGRILRRIAAKSKAREDAKRERARKRLIAGRLGRDATRRIIRDGTLRNQVSAEADGLIRCIVRSVGTIGDQAEADLAGMRTAEQFEGQRGKHHRLERTTLERVQVLRDWSAAIITLTEYRQFGSYRWGGDHGGYGKRGGCQYRAYLIVRDTTTGEAHVIRIPPRFGNPETQFFCRFGSEKDRIQAAVAWTFGREASEYAPAVEA